MVPLPCGKLHSCLQVCIPSESGRLFTLFLTSPVMAMCALVKLEKPDGLMLATCQVRPATKTRWI